MSRYNVAIFLLFLTAIGLWRWFDNSDAQTADVNSLYQPAFIATDLITRHYAANGALMQTLLTDKAEHYNQLNSTELTRPRIITKNRQGGDQWQLTGDKGVLNDNDSALLRNHVELRYLGENPIVQQMTTDYLEMDFAKQQVRTNLSVEITGPGFTNRGTGLLAELQAEKYQLLSNSHARYFNPSR
ncbi:LPS export ABC transporter periplasmic protein LptC [Pseudaeromonas sharmana]|uniref:Lipopolysaccharide export system protein LptC n=1 Tax=Pseudaeromonas sharmana TaxID=328412 RepID=A0ABV8CNY7_9GAMM